MTQMEMKHFSNNGLSGQMQMIANTEDNDDLGSVDTFIGDMGITYGFEKAHGILKNVDGGQYSSSSV